MRWRYRHTILALCTLAFFATMVARLVISPVVPDITDGFGVSNGSIGLALSGMWAAYALLQFPSGVFGDRFGERQVILVALSLTALSSVLLALSPSFALFALAAVALGAGAGLHYSVATTFIAGQFETIGRAIGVHVAGGPLAGLLAPAAAAFVATQYGWRAAIAVGAAAALPVFLVFFARVRPTRPKRPDQPLRERVELGALVELLSRPAIAYTTLLAVVGAFAWQATASFLPTFLFEYRGYSQATAGLVFSAYFVIHGATQPVMGGLSDRYGRDVAVGATMLAGVVAYGLLLVRAGFAVTLGAALLAGVAMSWGAPLQSRFLDRLSEAERGAGFGLVRTVYMLCGALGSVVVGALADAAGWPVAFGILSVLMAGACGAIAVNRLGEFGL